MRSPRIGITFESRSKLNILSDALTHVGASGVALSSSDQIQRYSRRWTDYCSAGVPTLIRIFTGKRPIRLPTYPKPSEIDLKWRCFASSTRAAFRFSVSVGVWR